MDSDESSVLLSSRSRLKIADLLSTRPRTLAELAGQTSISVQAVLKHLERLDRMGILEKRELSGRDVTARRVYSLKGAFVGDFSIGDLTVVGVSRREASRPRSADTVGELEALAVDALVQRRRIREQAKRLRRMIDELAAGEERMAGLIEALGLDDEDRLVLQTAYSEETLEDAEKSLARVHGFRDPRRSIERATAKAKRNAK